MGPDGYMRRLVLNATVAIAMAAGAARPSVEAMQQPAASPKPQPAGVVIRGCLTGSKLTHLDVENLDPALILPDTLKVASIRVIRSQVKALHGHQVEVIGTLRGIPGQDTGLLVVDSDKGKLYVGGGDARLGQDLVVAGNQPPTIYAQTIKNVADTCTAE